MQMHGWTRSARGHRLAVWAPRAEALALRLGELELPLRPEADGWWVGEVDRLEPGTPYALVFPDGRIRPDPAARAQVSDVHGPSEVFHPDSFRWSDEAWPGVPAAALVFYELHVGTFTEEGTLDAAAQRLPDLVELGVTCVELMPVQPFAGTRNWGYDGVLLHAVHRAYGGPAALQRFVDRAHALGLGVCLDVVYNHLGPEGNYLGEFGPYTTPRHRSPWGDGMNYDGPDSAPVRAYMVQAATGWIRDFHVDALRLDAVHAIVDDSPVHLVAELVAAVAQVSGGRAHVIAESDLNDRKVVDPPPRGWGCTAAWADDFHHAVHALLTGEREAYYADFAAPAEQLVRALQSGFAFQGEHSSFRRRPHGTDTRGLLPRQFVVSLQNHDQVGNRPGGERLSRLVPSEALEPLATLLLLGPGLPLLFMGEEQGAEQPFLYFTSHQDPDLARAVTEGRKREFIARAVHVPDPQAESTFRASQLGATGNPRLRDHHRRMLAFRAQFRDLLATHWPEVTRQGRGYRLKRPGLEVAVNLGPQPALGLPGWGWSVTTW
jgi:maltooligosyltrehalose trehalohydrolase